MSWEATSDKLGSIMMGMGGRNCSSGEVDNLCCRNGTNGYVGGGGESGKTACGTWSWDCILG